MSSKVRVVAPLVLAATAGLAPGTPFGPARLQAAEVVATGLVNPRGIAQAPSGRLYVAEAGNANGGTGCSPATPCFGLTGALTLIDSSGLTPPVRILSGLPSVSTRSLAEAAGPHHISFQGQGGLYLTMGLGGDVPRRDSLGPQGAILGKVLKVAASGQWKAVADIAAHEQEENPDSLAVDSNPYGITALPSRQIVADAGANALVEVRADGQTRTLAVFPSRTVPAPGPPGAVVSMQPVPTSVAEGPDGFLYVGQLTGFPFPAGGARVYRVPADGGVPEVCATGFTLITDIAFDAQGRLYVLQFASGLGFPPNTGKLLRLDACGSAPVDLQVPLSHPTGLVIGQDGAAYVTNKTLAPAGTGEVLRIPLN